MRNTILAISLVALAGGIAFAEPKTVVDVESERIGKLLKDMGHDPQRLSPDVWQATFDRDSWKVHVMIALAADTQRIWLECKFAPVPAPELVPSSAWLRLLEENERISPAHFSFDKNDQRIHLYKSFDNQGVTAARLKQELDSFDAVVRRTQAVWRGENFAPAEMLPIAPRTVEQEPKKMSLLDGNWRIVRVEARGKSTPADQLIAENPSVAIAGDQAILKMGVAAERTLRVKLDPKQKPPAIDFIDDQEHVEPGIYMFEAGLLLICVAGAGENRPRQFVTDPKNKTWLLVLQRNE